MADFWLGLQTLDRFVHRTTRVQNGADVSVLTRDVTRLLRTPLSGQSPVITPHQIAPDENDVWCSLQRLVARGQVVKFLSQSHGVIHYRGIR